MSDDDTPTRAELVHRVARVVRSDAELRELVLKTICEVLQFSDRDEIRLAAAALAMKHREELFPAAASEEDRRALERAERRHRVLAANGRGARKLGLVKP